MPLYRAKHESIVRREPAKILIPAAPTSKLNLIKYISKVFIERKTNYFARKRAQQQLNRPILVERDNSEAGKPILNFAEFSHRNKV